MLVVTHYNLELMINDPSLTMYHFQFGDTPSCLDQGEDNVGEVATLLGYGNTENGRNGFNLLEANVTLISNEECRSRLQHNISSDPNKITIQELLCNDLPNGINDQFLCATGIYNEEKGIFSGSCKGDSGGPLYVDDSSGKRTFAGIVSGTTDILIQNHSKRKHPKS